MKDDNLESNREQILDEMTLLNEITTIVEVKKLIQLEKDLWAAHISYDLALKEMEDNIMNLSQPSLKTTITWFFNREIQIHIMKLEGSVVETKRVSSEFEKIIGTSHDSAS